MCCRGIVAYYVQCMNVVKKWYGSDCVNQGYQGRRGWVFKLLHAQRKLKLTDSEREEESAEFKNTYSPRSPLPLTVVPSSVTPERVWSFPPPPPRGIRVRGCLSSTRLRSAGPCVCCTTHVHRWVGGGDLSERW